MSKLSSRDKNRVTEIARMAIDKWNIPPYLVGFKEENWTKDSNGQWVKNTTPVPHTTTDFVEDSTALTVGLAPGGGIGAELYGKMVGAARSHVLRVRQGLTEAIDPIENEKVTVRQLYSYGLTVQNQVVVVPDDLFDTPSKDKVWLSSEKMASCLQKGEWAIAGVSSESEAACVVFKINELEFGSITAQGGFSRVPAEELRDFSYYIKPMRLGATLTLEGLWETSASRVAWILKERAKNQGFTTDDIIPLISKIQAVREKRDEGTHSIGCAGDIKYRTWYPYFSSDGYLLGVYYMYDAVIHQVTSFGVARGDNVRYVGYKVIPVPMPGMR